MTREELETVLRVPAAITADNSFVVIRSQSHSLLKHRMIDADCLESRLRQLDFPSEQHVAWARRRSQEALT